MIRAIVTDIEGTTSSLSFVKDVLFPYARERMAEFVRDHGDQPEVRHQLDLVRAELDGGDDAAVVAALLQWIDEDRKATPLKALQGLIWEHGYRVGDFQGHAYEDAVRRLREWHAAGIALYVFSSGSVHAQRLLFGNTAHGDLTPLFSGYFDTRVGSKREPDAYREIAAEIGLPPEEVLFLSDIEEELTAAQAVGMRTAWLVRDAETPDAARGQVRDFDAIDPRGYS